MTRVSRDDDDFGLGRRERFQRRDRDNSPTGTAPLSGVPARRPLSARASSEPDVGRIGRSSVELCKSTAYLSSKSLAPRASALFRAVQRGDYKGLTSLLGSSTRYSTEQKESVDTGVLGALLTEASGREHLDCIELLLQRMDHHPKRTLRRRGYFPMHTAAAAGAIESIELLVSAGLSPKTRDDSGRTPLHHASLYGSVNCVSFLCAVARSTLISHDSGAGDTPLHFAVRASRIVCIEVLLFHAGKDITQEKNGRDETPLDVARRIGDDTVILALQGKNVYRRRIALATRTPHSKHLRGQGSLRSRLENGVDVQRIMAVWEKFFENAAIACLEPKKNHSSIDEGKNNVEGVAYGVVQLDDSQGVEELIKKEERSVVSREGRRWGFGEDSNEGGTDIQRHQDSDEIKMSNLPEASADVASGLPSCVLESLDNSLDQSGVSNHSLGEFAIKWTEVHPFQNAAHGSNTLRGGRGGCDEDSTGGRPGNRRHQDSEDTRISNLPEAFADASSGLGYYVLESLDNSSDQSGASKDSRGDFTTQCGEEHSVQNAAHGSSTPASDDTYLFQSPKGSTGEWAWSPEIHQSTFQITPGKSTKTDVLSDGSSLPDKRWIACWDSASKLIYFWNLETGESSWEAPPTTDGTEFSSSLLWDPQHRAFFAVDEWGSSHWIENSPVTSVTLAESHMGVVGNTIGQATAVENGTTEAQQWAPAVSQELEVITSPQNEGSNTFHAIGDGEAWFWDVHLNDNGNGHPINPSKYSPEYEKKAVETQRVCNSLDEFFDAQEYFSCVSSSPNTKARVTGCASIDRNGNAQATEEEMRSSVNPVSSVSKNTEEEVESVEKIDSRTCYDEKQPESSAVDCVEPYQTNQTKNSLGGIGAVPELSALPAWLLWCAQSPDTPTYYVNEETNISSWLLPPEAVVQSCGWLRAWSEEFQSYFYANHWTGRVTWELKDFDVTSEKMRMYDPSLSMK